MKRVIIVFICLLFAFNIDAQTKILNKQAVFGTWTKSKSPYIIEGEAIVPEGMTLKIKPGVVIQFKTGENKDYFVDGYENPGFNCGFLRVKGKIIAKGKKTDLIKFTRLGEYGTWGNVSIYSRDKDNLLEYCWFESSFYVRQIVPGDNATGAVSFNNATGTVKNCLFINNGWTALNCKNNSNPVFINNTVVGNQYGIESNSDSSPKVISCIIWDNAYSFFINPGASIKISYSLYPDLNLPAELVNEGNNITGVLPDFVNQMKKDFSLKKTSPAYKMGKDKKNMGAF